MRHGQPLERYWVLGERVEPVPAGLSFEQHLRCVLGLHRPEEDVTGYAFNVDGWATLEAYAGSLRVQYNAAALQAASAETILFFLLQRDNRYAVSLVDHGKVSRRQIDWTASIQHFADLMRRGSASSEGLTQFAIHRHRFEEAGALGRGLARVAREWRAQGGSFDLDAAEREEPECNTLVVSPQTHLNDDMHFRRISRGYHSVYGQEWCERTIGRPVADQPDQLYARHVCADYETTYQSAEPRADLVSARFCTPKGFREYIYGRILLPLPGAPLMGGPARRPAALLVVTQILKMSDSEHPEPIARA